MTSLADAISCSFEHCDSSIVERVTLATVDQLCVHREVDITWLDALEFPLSECLNALAPYGVRQVDVAVEGDQLRITVTSETRVARPPEELLDAADIVQSFFEWRPVAGAPQILLVGSLN